MTDQLANADGMSAAEINEARRAGRFDHLLAGKPKITEPEPELEPPSRFPGSADAGARGGQASTVDAAQLSSMSPAQINQARRDGRLNHLLGIY